MNQLNTPLSNWTNHAYQLAVKAGEQIMHFYAQSEVATEYKSDQSPLTAADKAAHEVIYQGLKSYVLDEAGPAPVLSEEGKQFPFIERQTWQRYWCVDPLDGTREFLAHNDEFAVNIALIAHHEPILGVIYVPAKKIGYMAWRGGGAYHCLENGQPQRIVSKHLGKQPIRLIVSRHCSDMTLQPWLAKLGNVRVEHQGSAWKFGRVAQGEADLILRLSPTNEWDNAAGHCIVQEAGGVVASLLGHPLEYNRSGITEQGHFMAAGDKSIDWLRLINP
ncbi:MAG: 3'(2'),5'-bisphosphate nucleotidase CysQ [Proteobacteria bacterium]|nr:3'(2'),5'-bisphosphate nucleotidase CysQ [Pseudomonadota bacterium]